MDILGGKEWAERYLAYCIIDERIQENVLQLKDLSLESKNTPYFPAQWLKHRHNKTQCSEILQNQKHMKTLEERV